MVIGTREDRGDPKRSGGRGKARRPAQVITYVITYTFGLHHFVPNAEAQRETYMVSLKIRRVGNSLGLVLPKEVVSRLRTDEGDEVFLLEGPNNTYQLTPFDPKFKKKMEKAEEIMSRYRNALNVLAK